MSTFKKGDIVRLKPDAHDFSKFTKGKTYSIINVTKLKMGRGHHEEEIRLINDLGMEDWFINDDRFFELCKNKIVHEIIKDL